MAQGCNHCPVTAEKACVRYADIQCEFCGSSSDTGTGISLFISVFSCQDHSISTTFLSSS